MFQGFLLHQGLKDLALFLVLQPTPLNISSVQT